MLSAAKGAHARLRLQLEPFRNTLPFRDLRARWKHLNLNTRRAGMAQAKEVGGAGGHVEIVPQSRLLSHKRCYVFTGTSVRSGNHQMLRQKDAKGGHHFLPR